MNKQTNKGGDADYNKVCRINVSALTQKPFSQIVIQVTFVVDLLKRTSPIRQDSIIHSHSSKLLQKQSLALYPSSINHTYELTRF